MNEKLTKYFSDVKLRIDNSLERYIEDFENPASIVVESMKYSLFAGGKRIRPALAFMTSELLGVNINEIIPFACAIEMVHTYSLIHDDLPAMDNDNIRRGLPTNHIKYGENIAILSGDALLTHSFEVLSYLNDNIDYNTFIRVLREFTLASGYNGMIAGQIADVLYENKDIDHDTLRYIHLNKTGKIINACLRIPAIIAKVDENILEKIDSLGKLLGMLFQITDDILDVKGNVQKLGKTPGKDAKNNKNTYIKLFGIEKTQEMAKNVYNDVNGILKELDATELFYELSDFIYKRDY
ncbi:MAG: polyprenyl synthetase family protein [Candidatus Muirbacterium halophilum]|nr:polyprenyl synthetase family protein [Candidatus Muirbacterium halophilum]MCK9476837.1 polyprenyl synthetase family protein [Candidatus Muirbacterium halophilum]